MPRLPKTASIEAMIAAAVEPTVNRMSRLVEKHVALVVAAAVKNGAKAPRRAISRPRRKASEITRWVADQRARRVPTFVIEATRLDTKKKIVAKYGKNAQFYKGKALPKTQ